MFNGQWIAVIMGGILFFSCTPAAPVQEGDLIFHTSRSPQSRAIQLATHSKYSHMGIIFKDKNKFFVLEAAATVRFTPLDEWINRGENKHFVAKRLKEAHRMLNKKSIDKMKTIGKMFVNKKYDIYFEWSDERMYCSELVWKIYKKALNIELGKLEKLNDFDLSHPHVRVKLKQRFKDKLPEKETVVSPQAMFESSWLTTVD
ncbi:MAG: YiiX family permuted papain-like enzyme [Spirochaetes bacterium]|nr:YiiX family permuted papain-like enzyme [Spirochaetota bacterium]